jgi:hypothetical protein
MEAEIRARDEEAIPKEERDFEYFRIVHFCMM